MTDEQSKWLMDAVQTELSLTMSKEEVTLGLIWLGELMTILKSNYYGEETSAGILLFTNSLPLADRRFPILLHAFANLLEVKLRLDNQDDRQ